MNKHRALASSVAVTPVTALPLRAAGQARATRPAQLRPGRSGALLTGTMRLSPPLLAVVLVAHAGLLYGLLSPPAPAPVVRASQPLSVRLIVPETHKPVPVRPQPKVENARVQPRQTRTPRPAPPVLTAARTHAEPAPVQPVLPLPVAAPPDLPIETEAAPVPAVAVPSTPPAPLVQPRFNADYLDNPKPSYPALSRRLQEEGEVRLRVAVDSKGNASTVELFRSSGFARLDRIALETVQRWRFVPARQGDQAVAAWVIVPISFNLRSE